MTDSRPVQAIDLMLPANETERLAALHRYQILDTPPEVAFDRITTLAARLFKMPTVLISLVDESRAWFKSNIGFSATEVLRDHAICSFAVLTDEPLIVPDTRLDARFAGDPLVQGEPGMRFYAGAPLVDRAGFNLGTLCLLDRVPHCQLTAEEEATLVDLAAMVVSELELRLAAQQIATELERQQSELMLVVGTKIASITIDRKQAAEELYQSQLLAQRQLMEIEAIYQTAPIGLAVFDRELRYVRINQRLAEINGIAAEDHIGRTMREIIPTMADENEPLLHSVFATGEPLLNIEISGETAALPGVDRTWIENCYPLQDATGAVMGINIVVQEITDRKRAEVAIQEGQAQLNFLLAAAEFGDWDLNLIDRTAQRSLRHDRIFGYESLLPQWTDEMFLDHILPEDRAEVERKYQNAIATNEPWDFECRIRRVDRQVRWIWASGYVYHNAQGIATRMLGLVADITDRKTTELALAERNQELTSFAYTVSHDLKAPLRAIANLSVWIEEDLDGQLPPNSQKQFQLLRTRVKRMESMIDSLLLYARAGRQAAELETFDLAEFLGEIIDSLAPPEGFRIEIQPPLPKLTTNRVFLSQVFANLISNAIKHHTSVTGHLHISAIEHLDYDEFIIKDDGPGIAPEHHEQVFAIFQTLAVKDNSDSTGIGLAIVKKIVETEQGTIRLESSLGQGSTFYVTWPKSRGSIE